MSAVDPYAPPRADPDETTRAAPSPRIDVALQRALRAMWIWFCVFCAASTAVHLTPGWTLLPAYGDGYAYQVIAKDVASSTSPRQAIILACFGAVVFVHH